MSWSGNRPSRGFVFPRPFVVVKWTIYLVAPAALWAAHNYRTLEDYFDSRGEMRRNRAEVVALEMEHARLLAEKRKLDVGGFEAEKAVRERLMMVRPGEKVILLESESEAGEEAAASTSRSDPAEGNDLEVPPRTENEDGLEFDFEAEDGAAFEADPHADAERGVSMDSDPG